MKFEINIDLSKFDRLKEKFEKRHYPKKYKFEYDREFLLDPHIVEKELGRELTDKEYFSTEENPAKKLIHPKMKVSDEIRQKCWESSYILGENVALSTNSRWCQRNGNMLVFGNAGTRKSRSFIGSNILQANGSMIINDVDGLLLEQYGTFLQNQGYKIECLNLKDMNKSQHFNPLAYIDNSKQLKSLMSALKSDIQQQDDVFWTDNEVFLMCALIKYLKETGDVEKCTFQSVFRLLSKMMVVGEDDCLDNINGLDKLFEDLYQNNKNSVAYKHYKMFKVMGDKIGKTVVVSLATLLANFTQMPEFIEMTSSNDLDLSRLCKEKTALFVITPRTKTAFNWLATTLIEITQEVLYVEGGKRMQELNLNTPELEIPVLFMLDECQSLPKINGLEETIATCRKYRISTMMVFHDYDQIEKIYGKDEAMNILANCDTHLLFVSGTPSMNTVKVLYKAHSHCIRVVSHSTKQNKHVVYNTKARHFPDEPQVQDGVYIFIRGVEMVHAEPYKLENHPNYQYTAEANPANRFTL